MKIQLFGKKTLFKDFSLSLIASLITTLSLQILVYPLLAKVYSAEEYGVILTVMGVANTLIAAFGNSLNNTRLIMQSEYERNNAEGDFVPVLFWLSIIAFFFFLIYMLFLGRYSVFENIILSLFVFAGVLRNYGSVTYRIVIDYWKNLWLCIVIAIGNIIGIAICIISKEGNSWPFVFLLGEILGIFFLLKSPIYKEKIKFTGLFKKTLNKEMILLVTTLSANLLVYLDRLLLYPLLGGEAVSVYTVASFFGKSLGILMNPMASVLLSYYAKDSYRMTKRKFMQTNVVVLIISMLFILVCVGLGKWGTGFFYPTLIDKAAPYLILANVAAVMNVAANMIQPAVLKFASTYWQLVIQVIYLCIYICLGWIASKQYGLLGFSYAALSAAIIKLIVMYIIGYFALKE